MEQGNFRTPNPLVPGCLSTPLILAPAIGSIGGRMETKSSFSWEAERKSGSSGTSTWQSTDGKITSGGRDLEKNDSFDKRFQRNSARQSAKGSRFPQRTASRHS